MAIADEIEASADRIERLERAIIKEAENDEDMRRLTTIPGPGSVPLPRRPSRRLYRILGGSSRPFRLAAVAQANKTARIIWAVLNKGGIYRRPPLAITAVSV
jgi:hypothetical protein